MAISTSPEVIIDVFGFGTDEPTRPLLPPGLCWICENSPQQEAMKVIDTRRNSRPENRGQSERKYVCEPCAKELGAAVGQVSAEHAAHTGSVLQDFADENQRLRNDLAYAQTQQHKVVDPAAVAAELRDIFSRGSETQAANDGTDVSE